MSENKDKKQTQSNIIDSNERIEQSNVILNAILNAMPDSVFCKNLEGRYIECNKPFEEFMAHPKDEIIGKTFSEMLEEGLHIIKYYENVDKSITNEGKTITQKDVSMSYNGTERFYDITKTPLIRKNADGEDEIFGLLGLMHDVDERYILIKDLQNVKAKLEFALERSDSGSRAKSEFLSRMSHELRTPMNAIMGMSQIAKSSSDIDFIKKCIDDIHESSCHLMRLISNLLEVSSGVGTLTESIFSFDTIIEDTKSRIAPYLDKKHQTLIVNVSKALPEVIIADEKRIKQVIFHLLTNACKFSNNNSEIALDVDMLDSSATKPVIKISVIDNGIGMSNDVLNTIFDIFEQVDGSHTRKHEGVGVGLTLSKYIVETMGGTISVASEPGKGSKFTLTVPVSSHSE